MSRCIIMREIDGEYLLQNHYYYVISNNTKYIGMFSNIFHYNYYSIAVFRNVNYVNTNDDNPINDLDMTKSFIINDYYFNYTYFYIIEVDSLMFKQVLRQKIKDQYLISDVTKEFYTQS